MAKLALAVDEERRFGPDGASFRITSRAGQVAHRAFGETVLVYRRAPRMVLFTGSGRVLGLEHEVPGYNRLVLGSYRQFAIPVPGDPEREARDPGVRRNLSLDELRFEQILEAAAASDGSDGALAEAQAVFALDRQSTLDTYLTVHDRVLARYRHRCAFTGEQFAPSASRPHPQLRVVAIRPRELGGPLHVRNYLPMVPAAEHAFTHGHLTLGSEYGFIVAQRRIDPELADKLLPAGRLELPADPLLWPDSAAIAYHRANIFDRD